MTCQEFAVALGRLAVGYSISDIQPCAVGYSVRDIRPLVIS